MRNRAELLAVQKSLARRQAERLSRPSLANWVETLQMYKPPGLSQKEIRNMLTYLTTSSAMIMDTGREQGTV